MPSSHQYVFDALQQLTFRELRSSSRLIEVIQEKVELLDGRAFPDQQCERIVRELAMLLRDVLGDRYQDLSLRAFAHFCVALDYFIDPAEQVPDALVGGMFDDMQYLLKATSRFADELIKYREWRVRTTCHNAF